MSGKPRGANQLLAEIISQIMKKYLPSRKNCGIIHLLNVQTAEWGFPLFYCINCEVTEVVPRRGVNRNMSKVTEFVAKLAEPVVKKHGCELWDVEYVREAGEWYLRIYIDKDSGVSINDCEDISRELDPMLDEADPIPDSYTFEVSSAGMERQLKRPSDFERFMGEKCAVKLFAPRDGRKEFVGTLMGYMNGTVTLRVGDDDMLFTKGETASVRLRMD